MSLPRRSRGNPISVAGATAAVSLNDSPTTPRRRSASGSADGDAGALPSSAQRREMTAVGEPADLQPDLLEDGLGGAAGETRGQRLLTAFWFAIFGTSGWFSANALYAEQPVFVDQLPEAQQFGNLLSVAVQVGNIFPIAYKVATGYCGAGQKRTSLPYTITVMLVIAIGLLVLCALTWHVETSISGHMYSVVLLGAAALCGGIGAMSNVTYWAMASRHNVWCIKAMSTGMTFGGLVTTALAVIQNAGTNPRFRVEWFLVIAAVLQAGGLLSFIPILRRSVHEEKSRAASTEPPPQTEEADETTPLVSGGKPARKSRFSLLKRQNSSVAADIAVNEVLEHERQHPEEPHPVHATHHLEATSATRGNRSCLKLIHSYMDTSSVLVAVCFAVYGMTYTLPSMLPYLPRYFTPKHVSDTLYLWMLVLQSTGDVLGRLCTMLPYQPSLTVLVAAMSIIVFMFVVFTLGTIYRRSLPVWMPMYNGFVLPCCCLVYYFTRGYLVTSVYVWVKLNYDGRSAEKLSSNLGFAGQLGALLGTMIMFVVVTVLDLFGES